MVASQLQPLHPLLAGILDFRPSPATLWRWHRIGIKVGDRRVKLNATKVGGKLFGTREDVLAFIAEQNRRDEPVDEEPAERSPETERALREAGLLSHIQAQQVDSESDDDPP